MNTPKAKPETKPFFPLNLAQGYRDNEPLILVNGLAEQAYSWFSNRGPWHRHFDLKVPEILVYDGDSLHKRIDAGGEITVDYLTDRLEFFLDEYVQNPPYHLVGSSLGGQILLTYAARHPGKVRRLVLVAPSGLYGDENLPVMEGVRRSQYDTLVKSVFQKPHFASDEPIEAIAQKFQDRKWKKGVLRTLRGTVGHSVSGLLGKVTNPTLIIWGANDRVISDVTGSIRAAGRMANVRQVVIPKCGHAPQIEKAGLVNKLVLHFLRDTLRSIPPALEPARLLNPPKRPPFWPAGKP